MTGFDGNDYRKRVLAAIEARGGAQTSDPFEWYDVPLEQAQTLQDAAVAEQVAAVWAFWQKQRDHPKYRGLVTALLAVHHEAAAEIGEHRSRLRLAEETRASRAQRDEERFAELDGAIERLVERFGGIPAAKLDGLRAFARQAGGIDPQSVEQRLARHRVVDDVAEPQRPTSPTVEPAVYRQVRADLDELGRILGKPPPASLYDLLGLEPGAAREQLSAERDVAAARNRELRPDRRRALVDDLLAAVTTLLLENDPEVYLDALAEEVTARLRARVAAAVLVEDEFTAADHGHLLSEAQALGLDHQRAVQVLAALARELGVSAPRTPAPGRPSRSGRATSAPSDPTEPPRQGRPSGQSEQAGPGSAKASHEALSQARAALRAGQVLAAQALVARARQLAGGTLPPIRAVSDEVVEVLAEAQQRWRAALQALAGQRYTEAAVALERLLKIAADLPGPGGESAADVLAKAHNGSDTATAALAEAESLGGQQRELALLAALRAAPDHPGLLAALRATGVQPATAVRARVVGGYVVVSWAPSGSPGTIDYRVEHVDGVGRRRALGTTQGTELEAAVPTGADRLSRYSVIARRAGISAPEALSPESRSPDSAGRSAPARPDAELPPVITSLVLLPHGRRVRLVYPAPASGRAEVRRLPEGMVPPAVGSVVTDLRSYGELVPGMGPGLAVDPRPSSSTAYVVLTIDEVAVIGASTWFIALPPVSGLRQDEGRLRWDWPAGCTEVVVSCRSDAPPERADDPAATSRKVTNTRYQIDDGFGLPPQRPLHVAVFTCSRSDGALVTASEAGPSARLTLV
ncbi:MAG TPA: hypothetical protein VLL08_29985 [Kineosporiaceae bacterium]|nr:hypothetical protein [Kineosporiaceae bacterium]